jgi:hypothetical protein
MPENDLSSRLHDAHWQPRNPGDLPIAGHPEYWRERLAPLAAVYPGLLSDERQRLWTELGKAAGIPPVQLRKTAYDIWRKESRAVCRRQRPRWLRQSVLVDVRDTDGGRFWLMQGFAAATAGEAIRLHRAAAGTGQLFKKKDKRCISKVVVDGVSLVVKEYRRFLLRPFAPDTRSWINAQSLKASHVPCVDYLAWYRDDRGSCVIMNDIGPDSLDIELTRVQDDARQITRRLTQLGLLIAQLHGLGILFKDLKTSNVHVDPKNDGLCLLDLDNIRFCTRLSSAQIRDNLQLMYNALTPSVPLRLRPRALTAYAMERGLSRAELRQLRSNLDFSYRR